MDTSALVLCGICRWLECRCGWEWVGEISVRVGRIGLDYRGLVQLIP